MNKNEAEQIIKKANETIENYNNLITSFKSEIEKVENVKTEAEKELKKSDEVPECYSVENGNEMYFVDYDGEVYSDGFFPEHTRDETANKRHRAFKTKKIAELFAQKTQAIADQLYFKELYDPDYVPDWNDGCRIKFYTAHNNSVYFADSCYHCASDETVYFSSYEIAQKCADWLSSRITK